MSWCSIRSNDERCDGECDRVSSAGAAIHLFRAPSSSTLVTRPSMWALRAIHNSVPQTLLIFFVSYFGELSHHMPTIMGAKSLSLYRPCTSTYGILFYVFVTSFDMNNTQLRVQKEIRDNSVLWVDQETMDIISSFIGDGNQGHAFTAMGSSLD